MALMRLPSRLSAVLSGCAFHLHHITGAHGLSSATRNSKKAPSPAANEEPSEAEARMEAYRQVQNLDFMTAAKELEEKKKQAEEEEKAKQAEMSFDSKGSENELSKVIVRLDALEETFKEIINEKNKISPSSISKDHAIGKEEKVASSDKKTDPRTR